ncbi:hypothetical protein [uncultured Bifidobacterium sp.]|uniref:hypothetical protein n=1 Tax=uncultured Bifidobacterium sp. TaxID=165187 RepID=UPI002623761C|nr:hypothetical protein [uncultured Bifidobacterium sp.]
MGDPEDPDWHALFELGDDDLDQLNQTFETGTWSGDLGTVWPERPRLRPGYPARLPQSLMDQVTGRAASEGATPAEIIRETLSRDQD